MFTDEQRKELSAPLKAEHVKERSQAGRKLSYVEGWHVLSEANRIFGFDGWTSETIDIKCVAERERTIGGRGDPGWGVSYIAKVRVRVGEIVREGVGAGHGIDRDLGLAHESALKEAETDARKRALMTFGNPFGLALYDKKQTNVEDAAPVNGNGTGTCKADTIMTIDDAAKAKAIEAMIAKCKTADELEGYIASVRALVTQMPEQTRVRLTLSKRAKLAELEATA